MDINLFVSIINFIIFYRLIKVAAKILKVDISITKEIESYYNIYCEKKILKKKRKNMSTLIYFEKHKNFNE